MKRWLGIPLALLFGLAPVVGLAAEDRKVDDKDPPKFMAAVALKAGGKLIEVESPGYASPCVADIDGDGKKDLLVGQFNGGKIKFFKGLDDGKFDKGKWLKAEGEVAKVPGVW